MAKPGEKAILYAFWASSCSWRVRAALVAKRLAFEERPIDIVKKKHHKTESYRAICPSQKVPALVIDGETLVESMAILQYLEETRPQPSLSPATPLLRARMREIVETIVAGIQPLQNVGLRGSFEHEEEYTKFVRSWTVRGLETLEDLLSRTARDRMYCVGDQLSYADLCLVPQVFNAVSRHKININTFPTVSKLYEALLKDNVFAATHPEKVKGGTQ
ncbi:probable maleylacetoacetate isomerase 1 [Leguminivora glycinivorella]|uniref:probable maleylacetoacetate isomerase 1 n=1 Tax=Leguminivora glycinivorella TaxID=1035111 RepID=UPI00200F82B2|nr:probable maleylacetoacetate isomerase 1 [Leguminivora glycinivorella]